MALSETDTSASEDVWDTPKGRPLLTVEATWDYQELIR